MYLLLLHYMNTFCFRVLVVSHCESLAITLHLDQTLENFLTSISTMPTPLREHDDSAMQATSNNLVEIVF